MLWENLKEKLPMEAEYTEMGETFNVIIEEMDITKELVSFELKREGEYFNVTCNRKYLSICPKDNRLLIEAQSCWTMLLKNKEVSADSSQH